MFLVLSKPDGKRGPEESHRHDEVVRPGVADNVEHQVQLIIAGEFDTLLLDDRFHNKRHPIPQRNDFADGEHEMQDAGNDGDEFWGSHRALSGPRFDGIMILMSV